MTETFQASAVRVWLELSERLTELTAMTKNPLRRLVIPDSALSGIDTFTKTAPASLAALSPSGGITMRVIRGERSSSWWMEQAATLQSSISDAARYFGQAFPSWERISSEIIQPTAQTVQTGLTEVAKTGADLVPWVAAALIAAVVGYLVFTFRGLAR